MAADAPRLFVSFSLQDADAVQMLFSALSHQGLGVWDYSREGEQLPLGRPVTESLLDKIDLCDYFLAVVSPSSTDEVLGRYTDFEVRCAVERGLRERHKLLPVLLATDRPASWRGAYAGIEGLMRVNLDCADQKLFDDAVRKICEYLSVEYAPPVLSDPRVFFTQRVRQEMSNQKFSMADYVELMGLVRSCGEKVTRNEWEEAGKLISLFLLMSDWKMPGASFYYPQIVKGVCELQAGSFGAAEQTFAQTTRHPLCDENSFGGLGQACFYQGRYAEALTAFQKSLELQPADQATRFNLETALLHAGSPDGAGTAAGEMALADLKPGDRVKVDKLKAIALLQQGRSREAAELFGRMADRGQLDAAAVIYYYYALSSCGRRNEALSLLKREARLRGDSNIYHHLADAYLNEGMLYEALDVYQSVLAHPGCPRKHLIGYARILKVLGGSVNMAQVSKLCGKVLDPAAFDGAPLTAEDWYYSGFANYLLGDHARARYDYDRSGALYAYYDCFD